MKGIEGSKLGRYELRCRVAQGGMSEVYLGYDYRVRRWVAIKVLYGSDEPFVRRFEREALAVGALAHEHILPLYDFGEQRPWYYLVMPYVEGGTLRDFLQKRERLTLEEAGSFLEQIASALQHAHDHEVVHRDVKPSNILLRPDGHAYLGDFGLAKAKFEAGSFSHIGTIVGTPEYMAPEQSNGLNDYRSDVYSLGIILYQMLTGRVPFTGESPVSISIKHIQNIPIPPMQINSEIPPAIEDVMLKALAKDPDERYQEARAFTEAYRKALFREQSKQLASIAAQAPAPLDKTETSEEEISTSTALLALDAPMTKTKTQLFPLGYETSMLPLVSGVFNKKRRTRVLLTILLCFMLLVTTIPLSLLWRTSTIPKSKPLPHISLAGTQTKIAATASAQAHAKDQAILAAKARVRATAGITAAIGAGRMLYYSTMASKGGGWIDDGNQCYFSWQGYHVYTKFAHTFAWCYTNQQTFSDVVMTAQVQLVQGNFCGIVFRLNPFSKTFYVLEINSHSQYRFQKAQGSPENWITLIDWTGSNAILSGYGQLNTFLIVANGTHFRFYVNQQLIVATFSDTGYSAGFMGFLVGEDASSGTEAIFSQVGVFQK